MERNKQWKEKAKCLRERIQSDFTSMFEQSCAHETRMLQIVDYHGAKESSMVCMHLHEARTIVDKFKQALLDHYHAPLPYRRRGCRSPHTNINVTVDNRHYSNISPSNAMVVTENGARRLE